MANKKEEVNQPVKVEKPVSESAYTIQELAENTEHFNNVAPEVVMVALRGRTEATIAEAQGIINNFLKKGVK